MLRFYLIEIIPFYHLGIHYPKCGKGHRFPVLFFIREFNCNSLECCKKMFKPSLEEFKELSKSGNLIPVYKEILADLDTPVSAYMKIGDGDYSFLLESVEGGEKWARYCFLGCDPAIVVSSKGRKIIIQENGKSQEREIKS